MTTYAAHTQTCSACWKKTPETVGTLCLNCHELQCQAKRSMTTPPAENWLAAHPVLSGFAALGAIAMVMILCAQASC